VEGICRTERRTLIPPCSGGFPAADPVTPVAAATVPPTLEACASTSRPRHQPPLTPRSAGRWPACCNKLGAAAFQPPTLEACASTSRPRHQPPLIPVPCSLTPNPQSLSPVPEPTAASATSHSPERRLLRSAGFQPACLRARQHIISVAAAFHPPTLERHSHDRPPEARSAEGAGPLLTPSSGGVQPPTLEACALTSRPRRQPPLIPVPCSLFPDP
jgi:hypothetical protein